MSNVAKVCLFTIVISIILPYCRTNICKDTNFSSSVILFEFFIHKERTYSDLYKEKKND